MKESTPDEKKHCGFLARSEEEVAVKWEASGMKEDDGGGGPREVRQGGEGGHLKFLTRPLVGQWQR